MRRNSLSPSKNKKKTEEASNLAAIDLGCYGFSVASRLLVSVPSQVMSHGLFDFGRREGGNAFPFTYFLIYGWNYAH